MDGPKVAELGERHSKSENLYTQMKMNGLFVLSQ